MTERKPSTLPLGTIVSGTCRPEDILPALLDLAAAIRMAREDRSVITDAARLYDRPGTLDPDTLFDVLDEVQGTLESYAPDYCFLGALCDDGAHLGVWPCWDSIEDARQGGDIANSFDTADSEHTHVLDVSDHGNATLYRRAGARWVVAWNVV